MFLDRLVNGCWFVFRTAVALGVLAALVVGGYLYLRLDDETRRLAESVLNRTCAPLTARVGGATFTAGEGVTLRDVQLTQDVDGEPLCLLRVDRLQLQGRFDVATLLRERPRIDRVVATRPVVCVHRGADGVWNFERLRLPEAGDTPPPAVEIHGGAIRVTDAAGRLAPMLLQNAAAKVEPADGGGLVVEAAIDGGVADRLEVAGSIDPTTGATSLDVKADGVLLSDELTRAVAGAAGHTGPLPTLRGRLSVSGSVARSAGRSPLEWSAAFRCDEGQVWLPGVDRPLTHVALEGEASNRQLVINRSTARWGGASMALVGRCSEPLTGGPAALRCRVEGLDLATVPAGLVPGPLRALQDRFRPLGEVALTAEAEYDGRRWTPRATIRAEQASFEDREKFRYRLTDGSARIDINGGLEEGSDVAPAAPPRGVSVAVDATGRVEGTPVRVAAVFPSVALDAPGGRRRMPPGWVEVSGVGVPITDRVIEALDGEATKRMLRSLRPSGRVDLRWWGEKSADAPDKMHTALDLRVVDCRINYKHFPYPLDGVTGWIRQRDRRWTFTDLSSRRGPDGFVVTGSGEVVPAGEDLRFTLRLAGVGAPLDATLHAAVPTYAQDAWAFLQPRGRLDFDAVIDYRIAEPAAGQRGEMPDVRLAMRPHQRELVVEPMFTPGGRRYRLERVDGRFDWEAGRLTMRAARADHGRTAYETDGVWETTPGGGWRLELSRLHADRLDFNHDFLLAAPPALRSAIETVQPRGGVDLFGSRLEVTHDGAAGYASRWDLGLDCHQASIQTSMPIEGISGVVRLRGSTDGAATQTAGELDLDSVFWNDLQLTDVRGPFWTDGVDCWLGEGAGRKTRSQPRRVTAKAYGGEVAMNGHVGHAARTRYGVQTTLQGVDVGRLAEEWLERPEAIGGRLDGTIEVQGAGESIYELQGRGALAISDADLYELPLMVRVLKVLRNRAPDGTAFDRVEAEFDIRGEQIAFSRLDLLGDAVSLYGDGLATLDRQLDLTFGSIVGRNEFVVPMFRSLVGQASEQLLRLRVLGTTDAPEVRREALPLVGDVIEQLQTDLRQPAGAPQPAPRGAQAPTAAATR